MNRVLISDLFPGNTGDMIYNNGNNWVRLTKGLTSQVLTLNSEGLPEWGSGSSYITSTSNTSDINLDVNAGQLTASFANNNISQFTNDAGYLTTTGITPASLTKTDDTNVTLTLGGTPTNSLLQAVSLTLGWTGTLADSRIASAVTWNAKEDSSNKTDTMSGNTASSTKYLSAKGVYDWVTSINYPYMVAIFAGSDSVNVSSAGDTLMKSLLIPANTFTSGTILQLNVRGSKDSNQSSSRTFNVYIHTAASAGGSLIAKSTSTSGSNYYGLGIARQIPITSSGLLALYPSVAFVDDVNFNSTGQTTNPTYAPITVDWTINQYINIFGTSNSASTSTFIINTATIQKL